MSKSPESPTSPVTSRRRFLTGAIGATGSLFAATKALAETCQLTPPQTEGPFYPLSFTTDDSINDLSFIAGHRRLAKGEVVYVTGVIQDESCRPIEGALVEIWQAAASGRYSHPSDTSGLELDPDFQGWGEYVTGADGRYAFKTIVPGHYPADTNWERPPHIHYKVTRRGYKELITQLYFKPSSFTGAQAQLVEKLNNADLILKEVPDPQSVIVDFATTLTPQVVGAALAYRQQGSHVTLQRTGDLTVAIGDKLGRLDLTLRKLN